MPCSKDPSGRSARVPPAPPPMEELLSKLRSTLFPIVLNAARCAVREFKEEDIYGVTVFTEAGLDEMVKAYQAKGHTTTREGLRWSPCDSSHHLFDEDSFAATENFFMEIDRHSNVDSAPEIERIFLECLHRVQEAQIFSPNTILVLMEGDQSDESRFAYAERFNSPESLIRFRSELSNLDEQRLARCRDALPNIQQL
jgi:hypothetical protein